MSAFKTDSILPPLPDGAEPLLHDREYRVSASRLAADRLVIQGALRDQKPAGLYIPIDPEPLTIHHMQLSLYVEFPTLVIVDVDTHFEKYPHGGCPGIVEHYDKLIGLSIARGFTHKVRELFGGPRGCTHTTALLQAMAPVAVQCFWSMTSVQAREDGGLLPLLDPNRNDDDGLWQRNINTCHVWAEDGEEVASRREGRAPEIPVFFSRRLAELGITAEEAAQLPD